MHGVDTVIKVLTKLAVSYHFLKIAVCCTDEAYIYRC